MAQLKAHRPKAGKDAQDQRHSRLTIATKDNPVDDRDSFMLALLQIAGKSLTYADLTSTLGETKPEEPYRGRRRSTSLSSRALDQFLWLLGPATRLTRNQQHPTTSLHIPYDTGEPGEGIYVG